MDKQKDQKELKNGIFNQEELDILKGVIDHLPNPEEFSMVPKFPVADYIFRRNHI